MFATNIGWGNMYYACMQWCTHKLDSRCDEKIVGEKQSPTETRLLLTCHFAVAFEFNLIFLTVSQVVC